MQEKSKVFSNFFDRISKIMEIYGITTVKSFACDYLGYSSSEKINRLKSKNTSPSYDILNDISKKFENISPEWLLTGEGEMLKGSSAIAHKSSTEGIPLIHIDAMAGFGNGEAGVMDLECERYVVPLFRDAEFLIQVRGSSMYPKYSSGDVVACKKLPLTDLFFQWNKVYVLDTSQGALIKRIKKGDKENHILVVSENPAYDQFELPLNLVYSVAIVIGVIRLE